MSVVGEAAFALDAEGRGLRAWSAGEVDGFRVVPDAVVDPAGAAPHANGPHPNGPHPNGVVALDHLVITTPDHARTIKAFEAAGYDLRRVRETGNYGAPMRQAFFKHGSVILEVIGAAEPSGDGPARLWGLAWTCADLDATAQYLGARLHPAKDAVQEGRRIATLDKGAGSTVPMAFMSQ